MNLNKMQEAKALKRRKQIYLELHPETKRGTAGGKASGSSRRGEERTNDNVTFVQDTATKTGRSRRSVERDVAIGEAVCDARQARIDAIVDACTVREALGLDTRYKRLADGRHEVVYRGRVFTASTLQEAIEAAR